MKINSQQSLGHLAMLLFSVAVAGSFSLGVMVANLADPKAITFARFVIAACIIAAAVWAGPGFRRSDFKAPWRYLVLGGLFTFYFVLMFEGLKTAPPVSASAVFTLTPMISAIFGYVLLAQVTTHRMALALTVAASGALWVIFRADLAAVLAFDIGRGEAIYFIGCVSHALYTPMVRKLNRGEPAVVFTFGSLVAGGMILGLISVPSLGATNWLALPPIFWITLAYISIFATAASFFLLQFAVMRLPSAKVMAYTYLVPSWVIVWEWALGHGLPPLSVAIGVLATVLALVLLLKDEEVS